MAAQMALFNASPYNIHIMAISFGDKLRALREAKGMSIFRLSKLTGVPEGNLCAIEKNRRPASDDVMKKISGVEVMEIKFEQLKAWQIMGKATPQELEFMRLELLKMKEALEDTIQ